MIAAPSPLPSPARGAGATPALLISCAREYIGTPWVHQARLRGVGVDCVGLLTCAARDAGMGIDDVPANYSTVPSHGWLLEELRRRMVQIEIADVRAGDVLAFAWELHPWHAGLVSASEESYVPSRFALRVARREILIVHAYRRVGKVIEQSLDASWLAAIRSAWRWPQWN